VHVFLSWSGQQSKAVAETLCSWISQVIQAAEPWISLDIEKGMRWSSEISNKLEVSKVGIICLTQDNLDAQWILFEAGALSKTKDVQVCTFLLGLNPTDVQQPLGQFQHTVFEKTDIRRLVSTINRSVQDAGEKALQENILNEIFETYWPGLEEKINKILNASVLPKSKARSEREMLQEILEILRAQERRREISEEMIKQQSTYSQLLANAITKNQVAQSGLAGLSSLIGKQGSDILPTIARMQFGEQEDPKEKKE